MDAAPAHSVAELQTLRQFLLGLAEGMIAANESVDEIHDLLVRISRAYGVPETDFVVLPTVILVQTGGVTQGRVAIRSRVSSTFRFDQIAELYDLLHEAERAGVEPEDGIRRLNAIGAMRSRFGWVVRTLGHALVTAGLSLMLVPTWQGALLAFLLGLLIGLAKLIRSPTLQLIFPTFAAFVCALAVFLLAEQIGIGDPLRLLIAPLATFLPGGTLTTATVELASGNMISGASRLVTGVVQLALLAFGIIAAGTVVGVGEAGYMTQPDDASLPWWVSLAGVGLFAVGVYLHFSSPAATFGWVLVAILVAFGGQLVGAALAGPTLSGFLGAVAMTPAVLAIAALPRGAPSQITFLPAFWLLVPGASGLISLTEAAGAGAGLYGFATAMTTVMSIAIGILIGTALYRVVRDSAKEIETFAVALPETIARAAPLPLWSRMFPGRSRRRPPSGGEPTA
ncbi:threonine/serine exporter family protein [Klugiella xanthotipulae]|uniref:Uncharacterized membrane protein YjjP (DUF1212 family) n=1 Tax=Klugiella xanthotipulae TaxID=244735 RepID=A0A543HGY5_9MICO|nr:threonine/serine exporter family protein [Klugiella xanthotipulae]TQM57586.1 uncharacterized membrane protein YjjP (DUF1212 family) [Klugiella xanthotipulae]